MTHNDAAMSYVAGKAKYFSLSESHNGGSIVIRAYISSGRIGDINDVQYHMDNYRISEPNRDDVILRTQLGQLALLLGSREELGRLEILDVTGEDNDYEDDDDDDE